MSVGVASGRPRSRVPSAMEAMPWCRMRQDCRARPSGRDDESLDGSGAEFGRVCRPGIEQAPEQSFAVASLGRWRDEMGKRRYPEARELFITADAGGSNGYRCRAWKHGLRQFADELRVRIHVSHFPPGTSKWNKIEHRPFCHVTQNWRGRPLRTFETMVDNTRTSAGLRLRAELDARTSPTAVVATNAGMDALSLHRSAFHGDWDHELHPR